MTESSVGPTLEQRRAFSNLLSGSHVPGYMGYCPQFKYRCGKSFGKETHELSKSTIHLEPKSVLDASSMDFEKITTSGASVSILPKSTGDNKYTEGMIPGYTGFIPRRLFTFGGTYRHECDDCVADSVSQYLKSESKRSDLVQSARTPTGLETISGDPFMKTDLNNWIDRYQRGLSHLEAHRNFTEAPIPGYKGFVPRFYATDSGLGSTYNLGCSRSLDRFSRETKGHREAIFPSDPESSGPASFVERIKLPSLETDGSKGANRLYVKSGMIPRYTGYIPQKRYMFGRTYGDGTRGLPACEHEQSNYGDYVRTLEGRTQSA